MQPAVYLITDKKRGILFSAVTHDLLVSVGLHREKSEEGFAKKHNLTKLVWFEYFSTPEEAQTREAKLQKSDRGSTVRLIERDNPGWMDLYEDLLEGDLSGDN